MNETRELAHWVHSVEFGAMPPEVIEAARIYVLDDLAAGCAGSQTPWAAMVADLAQETSSGPCSVFGREWTTSPAYAALTNGVMIGGFEVDHPFTPGSCHPSGSVFPAVLAISERERLNGKHFLTSIVTGYELLARIGLAATRAVEDERGFHGPGTNGAFGAAAGVGKALGFEERDLLNALGIAGSHGGGLVEFFREGAMTKRLHLGRSSQMGLECALLAQRGFTGPSTVLEGTHGFLHAYSPSPKPERLLQEIGQRWEMMGMVLKAYPCHISFHAVIDGIQAFRAEREYEPAAIERVEIVGAERMMEERFSDRQPITLMGAQYSLPFSAAFAVTSDATDPQTWLGLNLQDPEVLRIAQLMELRADTDAYGKPGGPVAEICLAIGGQEHRFVVTDWKGAPSNPYTYEDMSKKFARYAEPILNRDRIDEVIERVAHLESQADVGAIARLLAVAL